MAMVLGLTGGIGTGKSSVVEIFRQYGFPIVDGDLVARQIVEPNAPGLLAIITGFGKEILHTDGTLNRQKLGKLIFAQPEQRKKLDALLDPILRRTISEQISVAKQQSKLVVADIPLLFEANYQAEVDAIAVVYVPEEVQQTRLMARDNLTLEEAKQRIASQLPIEDKKAAADVVFDNQATVEETQEQVVAWLKQNNFL